MPGPMTVPGLFYGSKHIAVVALTIYPAAYMVKSKP